MLIWERLLSKIDHPRVQEIPYLAAEPDPSTWPSEFHTPWAWTGYCERGLIPRIWLDGRSQTVHRILYDLLIKPLPEHVRIIPGKNQKRNVNPAFCKKRFIKRAIEPPAEGKLYLPDDDLADEDLKELGDMIADADPRFIKDLDRWLEDYTPEQVFKALAFANLTDLLQVQSPENLKVPGTF